MRLALSMALAAGLATPAPVRADDGVRHAGDVGQVALPAAAVLATALHHDGEGGRELAFAAAAFVGYSRVESRRHFTSDVLVGGALGIGANALFTKRHVRFAVAPVPGGVNVTVAW